MTITLTPEQRQIVDDEPRCKVSPRANGAGSEQQEAVREMLRFVDDNRAALAGISVKELVHEGHHL
jgi:hypothetical protein